MSNEATATVSAPEKNRKKKKTRNMVIAGIVLAGLAVGGFLLWRFLSEDTEEKGEILSDPVSRGTIQSKVEGSGTTKAKDTAAITLAAGGTVVDVYVAEGEYVTEGQELYRINSSAAEQAVYDARDALSKRQEELDDLYEELSQLTVRAPFAGQLLNVGDFELGETVSKGSNVATLVDDTRLKLSLYFSYAYQDAVYIGQPAQVSVPAVMATLNATVEDIHYIRRVSTEGSLLFEVVVALDNPGTLTGDMTASAVLTGKDGAQIYPYDSAQTEYYRTYSISAKAGGPVEQINLIDYDAVEAGEALLVMGTADTETLIRAKEQDVADAQEKLDEAQETLDDFNAVAPISGTVVSCSLTPGQEVSSGVTAITISDTSEMTVEIQVDERNVGFVKPGMMVDLDQWGNIYTGIVESVSQQGSAQNGMATFPAIVKVDNMGGQLMSGMYVTYSFVASQSDNCLLVPIQCVRYINDENGTPVTVVFLQAGQKPDNAVTLGAEAQTDLPEGYYAVPVTTGLSDTYNIEITEGLQEGDMVFTNYVTDQGDSFGTVRMG